MLSFVRNGDNDVWVGFIPETGRSVGVVRKQVGVRGEIFAVWILGIHGREIVQGEHLTLEAAKADLQNWAK